MTFKKGKSGNPHGRPNGSPNRRTQLSKLLEPHAEELVAKAVELAKQGDANALKLCLERLIPKARTEASTIPLANVDLASQDAPIALSKQILQAIATQEISIEEGQALFSMMKHFHDVGTLREINQNLALINEQKRKGLE